MEDPWRQTATRKRDIAPNSMDQPAPERVLRAKYFDWCSAQLAERFLALSPDEIFTLTERAAAERAAREGRSSDGEPEPGTYRELVESLTEILSREVALPPFEEWLEDYERDPVPYDEAMLGFWRER